jgi:hypothetical protein
VQALSVWSDLTTHSGPSIRDLLSWGAGARQLVAAYGDSITPEDVAVFEELKCESPELLIVAVCGTVDRRASRRLSDSGVDGFVFFDQLDAALAPTVAAVFAGQMVGPRDLRASVGEPALSSRERQSEAAALIVDRNGSVGSRIVTVEHEAELLAAELCAA